MNTKELINFLNEVLPDHRILEDVSQILKEEILKGGFSDLKTGEAPLGDISNEVVNKRFIHMQYESGFGNHYVSQVAIGGVKEHRNGVLLPEHFFANLYYSEDLRLITVDFYD